MIPFIVYKILFGKFAEGFLIGFVLRILISLLFKIEMTVGGLIRTALVFASIYLGLWLWVGYKLFGG